jgi:hypothetical protein
MAMLGFRSIIPVFLLFSLASIGLAGCSAPAPLSQPLALPVADAPLPATLQPSPSLPSQTPTPAAQDEPVAILAAPAGETGQPEDTPTPTPSPLPTSTPAPTLTPWPTRPAPQELPPQDPLPQAGRYTLAEWDPGQAADLAALLRLQRQALPPDDLTYYAAWLPVALAYQEAALRFPDDPASQDSRWGAAYALAQYGASDRASQAYTALITAGLNAGEVVPEHLPDWFRQRQRPYLSAALPALVTNLDLRTTTLRVPGFAESYLVNLQDSGQGGLCFLLVQKAGQYQAYELYASLIGWDQPRAEQKNFTSCTPIDVDGDGWDEVLATTYEGGSLGATHLHIYSLQHLPPAALPFGPQGSTVFHVGWGGYQGFERVDGRDYLKYSILPSPGCSISVTGRSRWNGEWFESSRVAFDFRTAEDDLGRCFDFIASFAAGSRPAAASDLLDGAIRHWFRKADALELPEQLDELRLLKGLYLAYQGQVEAARGVFAALAASPTVPDSTWTAPANSFLQVYQAPTDIYRACQVLPVCAATYPGAENSPTGCVLVSPCQPQQALAALAQTIPPTSLPVAAGLLRQWGVPLQTSGFIDLDGDGRREVWLTVRHPGQSQVEVWALVPWGEGLKALHFEDAPLPLDTIRRFESGRSGLVLINGLRQYQFRRLEATGEPFLLPLPSLADLDPADLALNTFEDLRQGLYAGADPGGVYASLLEVEQWPRFQCPPGEVSTRPPHCPDYLYTLGLSAELAGQAPEAVQAYHRVWLEHPASAFALMARLRLSELPPEE